MKSHRRNKLLPRWAFALTAIMAVGGLAAGVGIMGDAQTKVQEPVTVENGEITRVSPTLVDLNGDGDTVDEAVPVAFYEAFYDADFNADGDKTDDITDPIDETVSVDLTGDGDEDDTSVTVGFYEAFYDADH